MEKIDQKRQNKERRRSGTQTVKKVPVRESIDSGDLRAEIVFLLPVGKLVAETTPPVRTPPGNSSEFWRPRFSSFASKNP